MKQMVLLLGLMLSGFVSAETYYLVRHAEKSKGGKDPSLTVSGHERAKNLAAQLAEAGIKTVYSTEYERTQQTAAPLAQLLEMSVESYDPKDLAGFAEMLKKRAENALIVGHSNTTPMLVYLLSGQGTIDLDETDYDYVFQVVIDHANPSQNQVNILRSLPSQAADELSQINVRQVNVFEGKLKFQMHLNGQPVGFSTHRFERADDQLSLFEKTTIEQFNINADIHVNMGVNHLSPEKMIMTGSMGQSVDVAWDWQDGDVSGHSEMARVAFQPQGKIETSRPLRTGTLERTGAIMMAHAMPVSPNQPLLINWFNGYDATERLIHITWEGETTVKVPAGEFETYRVKYSGGAPSQLFYIDKHQPKVVKIEVIGSPWHYELVDFSLND